MATFFKLSYAFVWATSAPGWVDGSSSWAASGLWVDVKGQMSAKLSTASASKSTWLDAPATPCFYDRSRRFKRVCSMTGRIPTLPYGVCTTPAP